MEQKEHLRGEILSTKIAILNWIVLSKYKWKECAGKINNRMQCTDLEVKMNEHENGYTYEKYVGNTKRSRHENVKVLRKKI